MRGRGGIILCILALVALFLASCDVGGGQATGTPTASPAATATFPPRVSLETSPCRFKSQVGAIEGSDVTCYTLNVPEDRSTPNSQLVHIAVAVFTTIHSPSARARPVRGRRSGSAPLPPPASPSPRSSAAAT